MKLQLWVSQFILLLVSVLAQNKALALPLEESEAAIIASHVSDLHGATRLYCFPHLRCNLSLTTKYYLNHDFVPVWSQNGQPTANALKFIKILASSYQHGLDPQDYHTSQLFHLIESLPTFSPAEQKIELAYLDFALTDAYLLYAIHMAHGRIDPKQYYPDWLIEQPYFDALEFYNQAVAQGKLLTKLDSLIPSYPGYSALQQQLRSYQQIAANGGFSRIANGPDLKSGMQGLRIKQLQRRLAQVGYLSESELSLHYDKHTRLAVIEFQQDNGVRASGVVSRLTLAALNRTVESRILQIELNLDRMRWLPHQMESNYLLVNIPNYSLAIYSNQQLQLSMPVIVGSGAANRTCILNSKINSVELNPYWGIPNRIATKEYLSKIQHNVDYLHQHNIRVFDPVSNSEIDPKTIHWAKLTNTNFSYFLRQDPGKKNALGKFKFIFANKCGIYLHDTPNPSLFSHQLRDLSHGCIRVSQPQQLALYLFQFESNWNNARLESTIASGKHTWVKLQQPLPIYIVYQTTWVGFNNRLQFRNDIYNADQIAVAPVLATSLPWQN